MNPPGVDRTRVTLQVNGREVSAEVEARRLLSDFLRHDLGFAGTRVGCEQGACGACTVRLDGLAVRSCLVFAVQAEGASIRTLEGLSTPGQDLTPLQRAFHRKHALQCGFCTAGFLLSVESYLENVETPSREEIRHLLSGNLCRCTGYANIVAAVEEYAAERARGARPGAATGEGHHHSGANGGRWTGSSVARVEDADLLTGRAQFVDDLNPLGVLHVAFHRTERAHARILGVDCAEARSLPGVRAVLAHGDLDGPTAITPPIDRPGVYSPARPLLAGDRVRFVGEAVAVALAEDRYSAEDACDLVAVEYEDLPPVSSVAAAVRPDAASLHEPHGNVLLDTAFDSGGVDAVLASAPVVVEANFDVARVSAFPMEGRAVLAIPTDGGVDVWTSTQAPHQVKRALTALLGVKVRVVCLSVGGGFGQKAHVYPEEVLIPWLALRYGRAVKWIEDRRENLLAASHARGQVIRAKAAASLDGRLLAVDADVLSDMGAYGVYPHGHILEALGTPNLIPGPYRLPAYRYRTRAGATNKSPGGAYRGVGVAVSAFVHERLLDMVAARIGVDAAEVRRRNLVLASEMPYTTVVGLHYDSGDYPAALERALALVGHDRFEERRAEAATRGRLLGLGLASYVETTGMGSEVFTARGMVGIRGYDDARIVLEEDGSATLWTSLPSAGQGLATSFAQLLADQLSLPLEAVRVAPVDTEEVADGTGTFGSRSAAAGGPVILKTAEVIRGKLREVAARRLEVAEWDLEVRDGGIGVRGAPDVFLSFAQLVQLAPRGFFDASERYDPVATTFSYGTHACVVEVDPSTGAVRIVGYAIVEDCGPLINPMLAAGQTHGATAQGIGAALLEAIRFGDEGQPLTTTMVDYLLPLATDLPDFQAVHLDHPSPQPGGYKGVAEGGTVAAPAAVANAVANAIGAGINAIPITPESVLAALAARSSPTEPEEA